MLPPALVPVLVLVLVLVQVQVLVRWIALAWQPQLQATDLRRRYVTCHVSRPRVNSGDNETRSERARC